MKSRISIFLMAISLTVFLSSLNSEAKAESKGDQVDTMLALSGLRNSIEALPEMIKTEVAGDPNTGLTKDELKLVITRLSQSYKAIEIYKTVSESIRENLDKSMYPDLLTIFRDPLYKKMVQYEFEADQPQKAKERRQFAQNLQSLAPEKERINLMLRMIAVTGAEDDAIELNYQVARGVILAMNSVKPADQQLSKVKLEQAFGRAREEMEKSMKSALVADFLYIYRKATNEEISRYITFHQTDELKEYLRVADEGLRKGMEAASDKAGKPTGQTSFVPDLNLEERSVATRMAF
ncbi:MAG TPA: hypothetical protein VN944_11670 [Nitrospiria bacterium]|nr:hypothetical protein [Nitrospiria bacterium]